MCGVAPLARVRARVLLPFRALCAVVTVCTVASGFAACGRASGVADSHREGPTRSGGTPGARSAPPADVTVTTCRQDPTDDTQVLATGTIVNDTPGAVDYTFTIEWFLGSMRVTQTSYSQSGVPTGATIGWRAEAGLALVSGGPYSCRIVRVIRTSEPAG